MRAVGSDADGARDAAVNLADALRAPREASQLDWGIFPADFGVFRAYFGAFQPCRRYPRAVSGCASLVSMQVVRTVRR